MESGVIRVFICVATRLYRDGLAGILDAHDRLEVVGSAAAADDALPRIARLAPDIVLAEVMSNTGGLDLLRNLSRTGLKTVALAIDERSADVVACAEAGACGYVTRDASLEELALALERIHRGELHCSPRIAAVLMQRVAALAASHGAASGASRKLTARQLEIAMLVQHGLSNKQIARELTIEVATVKNHVHSVLDRLEISRRDEVGSRLIEMQIQPI